MGDFSSNYTDATKSYIYFGTGQRSARFKPFLNKISYQLESDMAADEGENAFSGTPGTKVFKKSNYSIEFDVPAANLAEAIENHKNFQILARMVTLVPGKGFNKNRKIRVKFANLINSNGLGGDSNYVSNKGYYVGVIRSVSYSPDLEMGFLEGDGVIFAKVFKISVQIDSVLDPSLNNPKIRRSDTLTVPSAKPKGKKKSKNKTKPSATKNKKQAPKPNADDNDEL